MLCIYRVLNAQLVPYAHCLVYNALLSPRASNSAYSVKCSAYEYTLLLCYALLSGTSAEHGACSMKKCSALECMFCFTQRATEGWRLKIGLLEKSIMLCEQNMTLNFSQWGTVCYSSRTWYSAIKFPALLYSASNSVVAAEDWLAGKKRLSCLHHTPTHPHSSSSTSSPSYPIFFISITYIISITPLFICFVSIISIVAIISIIPLLRRASSSLSSLAYSHSLWGFLALISIIPAWHHPHPRHLQNLRHLHRHPHHLQHQHLTEQQQVWCVTL